MRIPGFLLLLCSPFFIKAQTPDLHAFEKSMVFAEQQAAAGKISVQSTAPTNNYDLIYQKCAWNIDPDTLFIDGTITSQLVLTEESNAIYFDISDSLKVDAVTVNGVEGDFLTANNAVQINLDDTYDIGAEFEIAVTYHGTPSTNGFGSFRKTSQDAGNVIWTLSEPYGASDWWPCKQSLTDKLDSVDVWITMPDNCKSGGPGLLDTITEAGIGWHTYRWKHRYPIATYLIGISVTDFDEFSFYAPHHEDSVLFYNLVYPSSFDEAVTQINGIVPAFEIFSDIYGDYPFADEKYGHMQFGWGGGMEHQTMSSVSGYSHELLVHEMAHQWFGDKITCASWHDIWLNEGFATYSTWLSYDLGDDPNNYYEAWLKTTRDKVVSLPDGSVYVDDTTLVSRIFDGRLTYYKGGWVLHMLRWELGDDAFFAGIKNYITDPAFSFKFVTTQDLISHLEEAADTSLAEYFDDWFYGQGFPEFQIIWQQDTLGHFIMSVSQTPTHESVDFFNMHVPLRLYGNGDSLDLRLNHTMNGELFEFDLPFMVDSIVLDPDLRILHANDAIVHLPITEGILQTVIYPNPVSDILHMQILEPSASAYNLTIWNDAAERVVSAEFNTSGSSASYTIDTTSWPSGLYMVLIKSGEKEVVQSVVVQ